MPAGRGIIVDLEAIDGGGGETQKIRLRDWLKSMRLNPSVISYPDYQGPFGEKIRNFLDGKMELTGEEQFILYSSDMVKDEHKLTAAVAGGRVVVRERGPNTTCAYQCAAGHDMGKMLAHQRKVQKMADLVIYIDIPTEESRRRKAGDNEAPDRFERDMSFLEKVRSNFKWLSEGGHLGKRYVVVDGTRSIDEVQAEIQRHVADLIGAN